MSIDDRNSPPGDPGLDSLNQPYLSNEEMAKRLADQWHDTSTARTADLEHQLAAAKADARGAWALVGAWKDRYAKVDAPRVDEAIKAAAKRNETIARLASELGETHRSLQQARSDAKSARGNAEQIMQSCRLWQARAEESMALANEAMRVGLEECEALRDLAKENCDDSWRQGTRADEAEERVSVLEGELERSRNLARKSFKQSLESRKQATESKQAVDAMAVRLTEANKTIERRDAQIRRWEDREIQRSTCCVENEKLASAAVAFRFGKYIVNQNNNGTGQWVVTVPGENWSTSWADRDSAIAWAKKCAARDAAAAEKANA